MFKVGDRVRVTSGSFGVTAIGSEGDIVEIGWVAGFEIMVRFTKLTGSFRGSRDNPAYGISAKYLTLITPGERAPSCTCGAEWLMYPRHTQNCQAHQ